MDCIALIVLFQRCISAAFISSAYISQNAMKCLQADYGNHLPSIAISNFWPGTIIRCICKRRSWTLCEFISDRSRIRPQKYGKKMTARAIGWTSHIIHALSSFVLYWMPRYYLNVESLQLTSWLDSRVLIYSIRVFLEIIGWVFPLCGTPEGLP